MAPRRPSTKQSTVKRAPALIGRADIDVFEVDMIPEDRTKGFFVAFDYTCDAVHEIDAIFRKSGKAITALTVREILAEEIAWKPA